MKGFTPTQRTLRALREKGLKCDITEKWIPRINIRKDLFGIIDIIALDPQRGFVGVQSTGQAFREHYIKLTQEKAQDSLDWLNTPGGVLELWGWRQLVAKRGGKAMIWVPRIHVFTVADIMGESEYPNEEGED